LVRVNQLPVETEAEPNDDYRKAPEFDAPLAFCGVIGKDNDFDCFSFDAIKGRKYRVQVYARDLLRASLDPVINVFGPDNKTIRSSDDVAGKMDPFIDFSAAVDGKHTVRIYDHLRLGGPAKQYRIEVAERQPNLALQLKELRRDEATPALVPSGGHGAFVVSAARSDYGEAAGIELSELPEGVTATTFDLPRGRSEIPVLLTAATDAKQASSRFQVQAHPKDAKALQVGSSFSQLHKLVLGQNRRSMFQTVTEQAVCAVVEKAPFEISLVQPKTPIVRQGSRSLTVNIKRDEGFDETVSLRTLYNPPGIGVNNSRKIAKGKDSVEIPITANGGAAIGNWPVILLATFSAKGGSQVISTNAIDLHVESQYFKYSFPKVAGQQGQSMSIAIGVEVLREFEDPTEVELVGLPKGVTSSAAKQVVSKDSTSIEFPIEIADDAKIGTHKTLNCVARMTRDGEVITQTVGTGALRIDKARPASGDVKKKMPAKQKSKPLSRLEQLRQANEGDN
ncbi:MAG: PPC domain-containing protein, partial [Planctomycetota bacterium]